MKRRAFPGHGPDVDAKYERAGQWLRATIFSDKAARAWCVERGVKIQKAASEGIDSAGGFLVPTELARAVIDIRESYGAFRRCAYVANLGSDSTEIPRRTGGTTAAFMAEGAAAGNSGPVIDRVNAVAKKIGALVVASSELEEDSLSDLVDFIANELAWAFAQKEDDCAFNGDGASTYGGMRGVLTIALDGAHNSSKVTATGGNTFVTLSATDMGSLIDSVRASAIANAAWFISQVGFGQTICRLAATGGGPLIQGTFNGAPVPTYLGFPVILCAKMPTSTSSLSGKGMLAFGDMYHGAVLGQRRGITVKRSYDRYLDSDQLAILGTERFDAVIHDMGDNTTAGSLAVLVGS